MNSKRMRLAALGLVAFGPTVGGHHQSSTVSSSAKVRGIDFDLATHHKIAEADTWMAHSVNRLRQLYNRVRISWNGVRPDDRISNYPDSAALQEARVTG